MKTFLVLTFSLSLLANVQALSDPQVDAFLKQEKASLKPLTLAQRKAAGVKPRHLRPAVKRDSITPPDVGQIGNFHGADPEPQRGGAGGTFGSLDTNLEIDKQNIDNVAPPTTDNGIVPNLKWSFSLSHTRLLKGGWVREQAITDLPPSIDIAAAELSLGPNAYRELHWHRVAEWGYILNGTGRVSAIDENGRSYISDVRGPENGLEILIIFTDGNFDRSGTTFMLSDWLAHTPLEIVAQNIVQATVPPPPLGQGDDSAPMSPEGTVPNPFVFRISEQEKTVAKGGGGWVKIQDSTNFKVSKEVASALVFIEPNGLRELHWHTKDEWLYILHGHGRATAFSGSSTARTFDFQVGDTGVFPVSYGHYSDEELISN